jgi:hypothetical protein
VNIRDQYNLFFKFQKANENGPPKRPLVKKQPRGRKHVDQAVDF